MGFQETYNLKVAIFRPGATRILDRVETFFYMNDHDDPWVSYDLLRAQEEAKSLRRFMCACKIEGQITIMRTIEYH